MLTAFDFADQANFAPVTLLGCVDDVRAEKVVVSCVSCSEGWIVFVEVAPRFGLVGRLALPAASLTPSLDFRLAYPDPNNWPVRFRLLEIVQTSESRKFTDIAIK